MNEEVKSNNVRKAAAEIIQGIAPALNDDPPSQITVQRIIDRCCHVTEMEAVMEKCREALKESHQALEDWILTYASDHCDEKYVKEARERIRQGCGTISYVTHIQERNRAALSSIDALKGDKR